MTRKALEAIAAGGMCRAVLGDASATSNVQLFIREYDGFKKVDVVRECEHGHRRLHDG